MNQLAKDILKQLLALLKGENLTADEKQLLKDTAVDAARVQLAVLSGDMSKAKSAAEARQINAQLASFESIGAERARSTFWKAVDIALGGLSIAAKAAIA